jgi:hypothetical protein
LESSIWKATLARLIRIFAAPHAKVAAARTPEAAMGASLLLR